MKALACLALALTACGSTDYAIQAPDASYGQLGHLDAVQAVEGPAELVDALEAARADWASAGVTEQAYVGWVAYATAEELPALCGYAPGTNLMGCARLGRQGIYMRDDMGTHRMLHEVMTHELGHILAGRPGHLDCGSPGADLMCTHGNDGTITERDVAFVLDAL